MSSADTEAVDDQKVSQFCAVTGADVSKALQVLQATDFNLQDAIELFFASGEGQDGVPPVLREEERATQLQTHGGEVRAPMPTKVDRLYGDAYGTEVGGSGREGTTGASIVDAFRKRLEEPGSSHGDGRLSSMFEPPRGILCTGGFEQAKQEAQRRNRWLVVNIQSPSNFDSHRLNRDTWRDGTIQALVEAYFILFQTYDVAEQGQELMAYYDVEELPVILVVDPVTGAPMRRWYRFIEAVDLAENFIPFTEISYDDPRAARLAASSMRKRHGGASVLESGGQEESFPSMTEMDEDKGSPEEKAQKAMESLPPEESGSGTCRIGIRLPDGMRIQRRFPTNAPVSVLKTWCISENLDAAAGKPFVLVRAEPGSLPLDDWSRSIDESGVANCMLQMRWHEQP
eukprot:jgi/Picre1/32280/NNA_007626.t1